MNPDIGGGDWDDGERPFLSIQLAPVSQSPHPCLLFLFLSSPVLLSPLHLSPLGLVFTSLPNFLLSAPASPLSNHDIQVAPLCLTCDNIPCCSSP